VQAAVTGASRKSCYLFLSVFFFQAEDGIRARNVTGVQTCALPILTGVLITAEADGTVRLAVFDYEVSSRTQISAEVEAAGTFLRSEERRVGREERGGGERGESM